MKNYLTIDYDNLFILDEIKRIDGSYYILYNLDIKKFELHSSGQHGNEYCLTFPFDALDDRAVDYVKKTRAENVDKIIEEIDRENEKLENKRIKMAVDSLKEVIYDS